VLTVRDYEARGAETRSVLQYVTKVSTTATK
jgi:hypothetical protein